MNGNEKSIMNKYSTDSSYVTIGGARSGNLIAGDQVQLHELAKSDQVYTTVFRANNSDVGLSIRKMCAAICSNNYFLYSKDSRTTGYSALKSANWNTTAIDHTVYLDCSSFVATCINAAGISVDVDTFTTSEEASKIMATGQFTQFNQIVSKDHRAGLKPGDILLKEGHTEIVYSISGETQATYGGGVLNSAKGFFNGIGQIATNVFSSASEAIQAQITKYQNLNNNFVRSTYTVGYQTITKVEERTQLLRADYDVDLTDTSLLTYPNCVQAPFIQLKVNGYTFGTYQELDNNNKKVLKYPNYINAMTVEKINGEVNTYNIELLHVIEPGTDPNLLDKIFSNAGYGSKVYITYGDYMEPSYTFKEEEAILLKITSQVDFSRQLIKYTLECTSNATALYARFFNFPAVVQKKPSDIIKEMLWKSGNKYGLLDVFKGMTNQTKASTFIASDDIAVDIPAQNSMNPIAYLNLVTTYMCSSTSTPGNPIKDAVYKFCIYDTISQGAKDPFKEDAESVIGSYFKIIKISATNGNKTLSTDSVYEVDVGYPTNENVINFSVLDDQSWSMLYDYAGDIKEVVYNVDNNGNLSSEYIPRLAMSTKANKMTEQQRTWWTNMTSFPITATLEIKGLITPVILMNYIRVNALFFGQRHTASGLYIVTEQIDSIGAMGYTTKLTLLRIGSDESYIKNVKVTTTTKIPVINVTSNGTSITGNGRYTSNSDLNSGITYSTYSTTTTNTTSTKFTGATGNIEYLLNFFVKTKGMSFQGACGILGNICHESGANPMKLGEKFLNALDSLVNSNSSSLKSNPYRNNEALYTSELASGKRTKNHFMYPLKEFTSESSTAMHDYGLVQWCYSSRKGNLYEYAKSTTGLSTIGTVELQANFIWKELEGMPALKNYLMNTTNTSEAASKFFAIYEMSDTWYQGYDYDKTASARINQANSVYNNYINKYYTSA